MPLLAVTLHKDMWALPLSKKDCPLGSSDGDERERMIVLGVQGLDRTRYRIAVETSKPTCGCFYVPAKVAVIGEKGGLKERTVWVNKESATKRYCTLEGLPVLAQIYPAGAKKVAEKLGVSCPSLGTSESPSQIAGASISTKIRNALLSIPRKEGFGPLNPVEMQNLQQTLENPTHVDAPTALEQRTGRVARTVLLGKDEAFSVFDDIANGDKVIGKGHFKTTYYATGSDGGIYAVSVCDIDEMMKKFTDEHKGSYTGLHKYAEKLREELRREAEICSKIPEGTRGVLGTRLVVEHDGKFYFVMKLCEGGDLDALLDTLQCKKMLMTMKERLTIGYQALEGLASLHNLGILHRDVKLGNVLLRWKFSEALLCDFGLSTYANDQSDLGMKRTGIGTPSYMAPEVVQNKPITTASDVWSLGVVLYEIFTLQNAPWKGKTMRETLEAIGRLPEDWQPEFPKEPLLERPDLDKELKDLISDMLSVDPRKRPSAMNAQERLSRICLFT